MKVERRDLLSRYSTPGRWAGLRRAMWRKWRMGERRRDRVGIDEAPRLEMVCGGATRSSPRAQTTRAGLEAVLHSLTRADESGPFPSPSRNPCWPQGAASARMRALARGGPLGLLERRVDRSDLTSPEEEMHEMGKSSADLD